MQTTACTQRQHTRRPLWLIALVPREPQPNGKTINQATDHQDSPTEAKHARRPSFRGEIPANRCTFASRASGSRIEDLPSLVRQFASLASFSSPHAHSSWQILEPRPSPMPVSGGADGDRRLRRLGQSHGARLGTGAWCSHFWNTNASCPVNSGMDALGMNIPPTPGNPRRHHSACAPAEPLVHSDGLRPDPSDTMRSSRPPYVLATRTLPYLAAATPKCNPNSSRRPLHTPRHMTSLFLRRQHV